MPRTKLDGALPNPGAVAKLIERYVKIERRVTVDEVTVRAGASVTSYYRRMKSHGDFTLAELRSFSKALKIPPDEMLSAFAEAIGY